MRSVKFFLVPMMLLALAACGGGETGTGATGGKAVSLGAITGFGSVWVNGVRFETSNTSIEREGQAVTQGALSLGMIVEVHGSINADGSGVADSIIAEDILRGPVTEVSGPNTLMVLGQEVQVTPLTLLEGFSTDSVLELVATDLVEVSGYVRQEGVIAATRIARIDSADEFRITGYVAALDGTSKRFDIGGMTVSYDGANMSGMHQVQPDVAGMVRVQGTVEAGTGDFIASALTAITLSDSDADQFELEGYVTSYTSQSSFSVNGVAVLTSALTRFDGGMPADIGAGRKLEVEGSLSGGVLYASVIEFEESIALESMLASVNTLDQTLTLQGLESIPVSVDANTQMEGVSSLAQLTASYYVSLRGIRAGDGSVVATLLEAAPEISSLVILQGPLDSFNVGTGFITVLGQEIDTSSWSDDAFINEDTGGGRANFFAGAISGMLLETEGLYNEIQGQVDWQSLEYE